MAATPLLFLVIWPAKKTVRQLVYAHLAALFQPERMHSEKEVNQLLTRHLVANDCTTVRRDFRYLQRKRDGSRYWRSTHSESVTTTVTPLGS
ncbi:MAG: DUF2087 domain-containing protein [Ktedonobacteraceae bacterium]